MKYSMRTLLLLVTAIGCLCAAYYHFVLAPTLPFAIAKLENDLEIKLWANPNFYSRVGVNAAREKVIEGPKADQKSLFVEVRTAFGEIVTPLCEMDVNLEGLPDSVSVAYSSNRDFAAIYCPNNPDILIFADLNNKQFASPMTIWSEDYEAIRNGPLRGHSDRSPGPVRIRWQNVLQEIRTANPNINVDWNCL